MNKFIKKIGRSFIELLYVSLRAIGISIAATIVAILSFVIVGLITVFIGTKILFFLPIETGIMIGLLFSTMFCVFGINEYINWKNGKL